MITHSATHTTAIGLIHLYFEPSVHEPGFEARRPCASAGTPGSCRRCTGRSPRSRSPPGTPPGVPRWFGKYAGIVMISANTTTNSTDQVGVGSARAGATGCGPGPRRRARTRTSSARRSSRTPSRRTAGRSSRSGSPPWRPPRLSAVVEDRQRREAGFVDFGFVALLDRERDRQQHDPAEDRRVEAPSARCPSARTLRRRGSPRRRAPRRRSR